MDDIQQQVNEEEIATFYNVCSRRSLSEKEGMK